MIFTETKIPGAWLLEPQRHEDERGYFTRTFCRQEFLDHGLDFLPVQSNISYNRESLTLRGLHFHAPPFEETKLVRCTSGRLFDVAVDLRPQSPAYKQWVGVELSRENGRGFFIPAGCAHGFLTLEEHTEVSYQMSPEFEPGHDLGIRWDDPSINIQWPATPRVVSAKDQALSFME
ncbi:dTDP-4-dehydrorhamnose 3,5-epimerase [Sneathiella sp.]|jgi:dTDP-4-dehydrorhamnose 3,5-epimerase|uniref:dTDP-4-dehydrorhamnose 3,5-epimerase n=1 Tax=Sneathiella sp. TaxID=1964365 RepID=UPI0039E6CAD6